MKVAWMIPRPPGGGGVRGWLRRLAKGLRGGDAPSGYRGLPMSVWLRCLQLIPYLEERGLKMTINEPAADAGIAVFVRRQDPEALATAQNLRRKGVRIVFDLCVNYLDETGLREGGYGVTREQVEEAGRMLEVADAVACGSEWIRERVSRAHRRAVYVPESIDRRHFRFSKNPSDFGKRTLTAVWCGQSSKAGELADIGPLLKKRGFSIRLITDRQYPVPLTGPFDLVPWSFSRFPRAMLQGDVCVTPRRTDNPYDLGHSHFKIGVFMAQGIPALASPLPSYVEVIEKTGGGRVCRVESDWAAALDDVLARRELLREWSERAREGMRAYWTDRVAEQYLDLFRTL